MSTIIEKARNLISEKKLDAVVISNPNNIRYISGYRGDTGLLFISMNRAVVMTDFRYIYQAKSEAKGFEVLDITAAGYGKNLSVVIGECGIKKIGFEAEKVTCSQLEGWKKQAEGIEFIALEGDFDELRIIKNQEELANIKQAEHIGDVVFTEMLNFIKPGMTELQLAAKIEYELKMNGAEGNSFDPIVASGIHSSMPHAVPTLKKIEKGDFITMDFGCRYNGYCSDMTRTVIIGEPSEKQKHIYNTVLDAQLKALEGVRAGKKGVEIDAIARNIINDAGYEGCFGHGLGHGVGLNIHEEPRASLKAERVLKAGMTLTIEPGVYIQNLCGVRIEDLVLITEKGHENFTFSPKNLIVL